MKDFFEDLGRKISDTADSLGRKTEEVLEVQKIKNQIRNLERNSERDLMDIGKMVYERYQNGEVIDAEFMGLCEEISARKDFIEECEKEIADIKGETCCDVCGATVAKGMQYCPRCGVKVQGGE